jgi:hypothetical protein
MQRVISSATIQNPPPHRQTVRIWAHDEEEAEQMVGPSGGTPELDGATYSQNSNGVDVLPFLTSARVVHCCNCDRWMYAKDYVSADHACIPAGQFAGVDLDVQVSA